MSNFAYKGPTPVKKGDKVVVLIGDDWTPCIVFEPLATQFVAKGQYFFYTDKDVTWKPISQ